MTTAQAETRWARRGYSVMKQAYCSECGEYVVLEANGICPGGHARSCYRDVRDIDPQPVAIPASTTVPTVGRKWPWVLAAVLGVGLILSAIVAVGFLGRFIVQDTAADVDAEPAVQTTALQPITSAPQDTESDSVQPMPIQPNADGMYPPILVAEATYSPPSAEEQEWALAMCAILTQVNGERHDLLGGCGRTPENVQICNQGLSDWWGIESREDLLDTLTWIEQGGHRRGFDYIAYGLSLPAGLDELHAQAGGDPELDNQIDMVRDYADRLGVKSISGWDYARYVFLCRRGYLGGYMSEEEAWQRIMPAARLMQANFSSWKDLGDNYLIGRRYWSVQETQNSGAAFQDAERQLLTDPQSPWVRLEWNL